MAHARGDYSDFVIGEIYPDTLVKIMSKPFVMKDAAGKARQYVKYTCTACNSGIIYDGRIDRIRSGRTCRCQECGRRSKRPEGYTKDTWKVNTVTADKMNKNNLNGNHIGEIHGDWFINDVDYTRNTGHGHTYYKVMNIKTGQIKSSRFDSLPHTVDNKLTNITNESKHLPVGTAKRSAGELAIDKWLTDHNIPFEIEYPFEDLKGVGNGFLRFDFKIKNKDILVEFQGEEHYRPIEFYGGQKEFEKRQIHDNLKRLYCKTHNYKLIEVPYNYKTLDEYLIDI